ncbi:MAG: phosphate acyltransferase PlsX [Bacteroidales bacterium]|nr:phosphate acyltransferase PlsX [Bacteroidales bacterium]
MRIGLDVMGGDFAPVATIDGAILAQKELSNSDRIILIGPESQIRSLLQERNVDPGAFDVVHAPDTIGMGEHPTKALIKKPESSIGIGFHLLKHKKIDAFASAGNSGAMVVGSIFSVNTIQGIIRPCTSAILPQENGGLSIMIDIGTNPDAKPDMMYQFAVIGSIYSRYVLKANAPRVGLLNIGEEEEKGNINCQSTYHIMKESKDFNFIGNVEGRDLFKNKADVIVCDGYTGNIVLKTIESIYRIMEKREILDDYFSRFNYENYGGTPILGVNGTVVMGHGISNDRAVKNMILLSRDVYKARLASKIKGALLEIVGEKNL